MDDFYSRRGFVERVECLIRGMGDDERPARRVMERLPRTTNEEDCSSARELNGYLGADESIPLTPPGFAAAFFVLASAAAWARSVSADLGLFVEGARRTAIARAERLC